ncbi:MAG: hypothetical protein HZB62_10790 [Nitrospirae bacterium]|nr:hypothetical protein [Nitrospirota bacterium]
MKSKTVAIWSLMFLFVLIGIVGVAGGSAPFALGSLPFVFGTVAVGAEITAAIRKALVWGTAKPCGAGHGLLILPSSIKKDRNNLLDDSLGSYWPTDSDPAEVKVEGDIVSYLRYDGLDLLIATVMGTAVLPTYTAPVTGTATGGSTSTLIKAAAGWTVDAYIGKFVKITAGTGIGQVRKITDNDATTLTVDVTDGNWIAPDATSEFEIFNAYASHPYDLADNIDTLFLTFCVNNKVSVEEYVTLKPIGMVIKGDVGGAVQVSFKCLAYDKTMGSVINTLVTFASVTTRETANRVLYSQGVFRINTQSGGALGSGDTVYPKNFELSLMRKASGDYGAGGSFDYIDEPTNDGLPEVKLKVEFPKYTATTHFDDWDANTAKKMDITFTGSGSRSLLLQLPNLKYANVDLPMDRGRLKHSLEFNCLAAAAAPTGMTGVTKPFRLTLVNTYGGDPLQIGN